MTQQIEDALVHAARRGNAIHRWVNDKTPDATAIVLTDATLYYDIPAGHQVLITAMHFDVETASDDCHFLMVKTAAVTAAGAATEISGHAHMYTGTAAGGIGSKERPFNPPILVKYATGALCISMKVDANDAGCVITCGWTGIVEPIT